MAKIPYGDAFIVGTPTLDRLGERLYAEQKQKEQQNKAEMAYIDNTLSREIGKIRSVDTPEYIKKYEHYKNLKKQLYNPKIQKDAQEYDRINREANLAMADAMQIANASQEFKEQLRTLATNKAKDPNSFSDDFLDRYNAAMNTPVTGINQHPDYGDLSNPDNYMYKGANTDFSKAFKNAEGVVRDLSTIDGGVDPNDKFKRIEKVYKGGNDPYTFYNKLVEGIYGSKSTRDFPLQFKYTPEQEQLLEEKFKAISSDPNYRKIYGLPEGLNFPPSAYNTEVGKTARLKAIEYALGSMPVEKINRIANQEALNEDRQKFQDEQRRKRLGDALTVRNYAAKLKQEAGGEGDDELWLDNYLDNVVSEASNKRVSLPFFKQKIFKLQLDPTLARGLERNGIEPEELLFDEKTKTYKPVYYTYDDKGNRVEYKEISQPLTKEQLKLALGVKSVTPTQRTKEMKASQSTKPKTGELD